MKKSIITLCFILFVGKCFSQFISPMKEHYDKMFSDIYVHEKKDSVFVSDVKNWHFDFGISISLGISKRLTTSFPLLEGQTLNAYSSAYRFSPEISFLFSMTKRKTLIKNEIGVAQFNSHESYQIFGESPAFPYNKYIIDIQKSEFQYTGLIYSIGIGGMFRKFKIIGSVKFGYLLYARHYEKGINGAINYSYEYNNKITPTNRFFIGLNFEINYELNEKWLIGINGFQQIKDSHSQYSLSAFHFSIIKNLLIKS